MTILPVAMSPWVKIKVRNLVGLDDGQTKRYHVDFILVLAIVSPVLGNCASSSNTKRIPQGRVLSGRSMTRDALLDRRH